MDIFSVGAVIHLTAPSQDRGRREQLAQPRYHFGVAGRTSNGLETPSREKRGGRLAAGSSSRSQMGTGTELKPITRFTDPT